MKKHFTAVVMIIITLCACAGNASAYDQEVSSSSLATQKVETLFYWVAANKAGADVGGSLSDYCLVEMGMAAELGADPLPLVCMLNEIDEWIRDERNGGYASTLRKSEWFENGIKRTKEEVYPSEGIKVPHGKLILVSGHDVASSCSISHDTLRPYDEEFAGKVVSLDEFLTSPSLGDYRGSTIPVVVQKNGKTYGITWESTRSNEWTIGRFSPFQEVFVLVKE